MKLGELFCGAGGLALGAILSECNNGNTTLKIKHEWANDVDNSACETYRKNICKDETTPNVICEDIRSLDLNSLTPIDIFAYGFPCNDFSIVGEQKGFNGNFGALYHYGINVLNIFKPIIFVAENVGGIASVNDGLAFQTILKDLENAGNGYTLTTHLYKAEEYGVPQTRHRYIIVGLDRKIKQEFKVPKPTSKNNPITSKVALSNIKPNAINNEYSKISPQVIERLKHIKPGENAWTATLPDHLKLNVKAAKMSQIYKRLDPNKPSYTITGSGGGGTHCYHYEEPRPLTNRERARIQSFPDEFEFFGSHSSIRKQIGMAVPPILSLVIFNSILKTLNGASYPYIKASYQMISQPQQMILPSLGFNL